MFSLIRTAASEGGANVFEVTYFKGLLCSVLAMPVLYVVCYYNAI